MYIYNTDLYLYKNVYCSIKQSTMYFEAEIKAIIECNRERWSYPHSLISV